MKKFDKMDIIVILLAGLALSYLLFKAPTPAPVAKTDPAAEKTKAADATPKVEGPTTTPPEAPPLPLPDKPELVEFPAVGGNGNPPVKYVFTTAGGGLLSATTQEAPYAGKTAQDLNLKSEGPIGSLARIEGEVDIKPWAIKDKTDKSITFEITTKDGLIITKQWTQVQGEDPQQGSGYLWDLKVTFKNTGTDKFASDGFSLYVGASTQLHVSDAPYVSVGSFAGGKGHEIKTDEFDESKALGFLWVKSPARPMISQSLSQAEWVSVNNQYYSTIINSTAKEKLDGKLWARPFPHKVKEDGREISAKGLHAGIGLPQVKLEAGQEASFDYQVYTGPRSGTLLGKIAAERGENMFYGFTGGLSKLFLWALNMFNGLTSSFGVAVILLTICVRLLIWPLHIKATRSMKRMGMLAPMMTEIKERYKAKPATPDTQRAQQVEMMGLYKEYGVNPLGGCLPLLLQMPIFFGYFGMLNHAVEMRGHSFLWAQDLTLPDTVFNIAGFPINPLPLLMTITMFLQMKLQPTPPSTDENQKMQMKIMKFMPLMFLFFCYSYASALALYWTVQNIISIIQTQLVKRMPEPQLTKRDPRTLPPAGGRGGAPAQPEKPKGPRIGGGGKSAFKG